MNVWTNFLKCTSFCLVLVASAAMAQPYDPCDIPPGVYCTYTQGGWGQDECEGDNVACLRNAWFDTVFPNDLVIGCAANNTATWTSSAAVANYLPDGGPSGVLAQDYVDQEPSGGAFTAQLATATLNVGFANAGYLGSPDLDELVFPSGPFEGMSVGALLALANDVIGGCQALPDGISYSDFTVALTSINENFDNCSDSEDDLVEPECLLEGCPEQEPILVEVGSHFCLDICNPVTVYWCCPFDGPPVFSWWPGCDPEFTDCENPDCEPLVGDVTWTATLDSVGVGCDGTWWSATFASNDSGCICVYFERQLSAELLGFTAVAGNGEVQLEWSTGSERENDHFEIQRSQDNAAWNRIAVVDGQGTTSSTTEYNYVDASVTNGASYRYRLMTVDMNGFVGQVGSEVLATPTAGGAMPQEFALHQNYPNPFNPSTSIRFDLAEASHVRLSVYDVSGREIATLVNNELPANSYNVSFDAASLPSGTYFYRLEAGDFTALRKMLLLK